MSKKRERFDREEVAVIKAATKGRISGDKRTQKILRDAFVKAGRVIKANAKRIKDSESDQ